MILDFWPQIYLKYYNWHIVKWDTVKFMYKTHQIQTRCDLKLTLDVKENVKI